MLKNKYSPLTEPFAELKEINETNERFNISSDFDIPVYDRHLLNPEEF